ncbi:hypothetical protein I8D64_01725 [Brachybacterium sp. MASK1Z-5]|uniref:HNH endonuclease n=1 Tax=Brachybacterium halotolerans TaxID=2795215 RepID=A0ABS1B646_9MICO|nr:hypothetical protein [Brachybacterium halotolerans]MBK0330122.1 hypothetical protein [Brachybacterium halotolerans]
MKPLEEFHRNRKAKDGRRPNCRECAAEYARRRYAEDPAKVRAASRAWRDAHPEQVAATGKAWREQNRDRVEANHWRMEYRRRARRAGHEPAVEMFDRSDVAARWGDQCFHCGGPWEHLDHFPVAVQDGGHHSLENVRPSCEKDNYAGKVGAKIRRELIAERDQIIADTEALIADARALAG